MPGTTRRMAFDNHKGDSFSSFQVMNFVFQEFDVKIGVNAYEGTGKAHVHISKNSEKGSAKLSLTGEEFRVITGEEEAIVSAIKTAERYCKKNGWDKAAAEEREKKLENCVFISSTPADTKEQEQDEEEDEEEDDQEKRSRKKKKAESDEDSDEYECKNKGKKRKSEVKKAQKKKKKAGGKKDSESEGE